MNRTGLVSLMTMKSCKQIGSVRREALLILESPISFIGMRAGIFNVHRMCSVRSEDTAYRKSYYGTAYTEVLKHANPQWYCALKLRFT